MLLATEGQMNYHSTNTLLAVGVKVPRTTEVTHTCRARTGKIVKYVESSKASTTLSPEKKALLALTAPSPQVPRKNNICRMLVLPGFKPSVCKTQRGNLVFPREQYMKNTLIKPNGKYFD